MLATYVRISPCRSGTRLWTFPRNCNDRQKILPNSPPVPEKHSQHLSGGGIMTLGGDLKADAYPAALVAVASFWRSGRKENITGSPLSGAREDQIEICAAFYIAFTTAK